MRGTGAPFGRVLDEAFKNTGVPRERFKPTKWGLNKYGKSLPVEYRAPGGAEVSVDIGHGASGPDVPHVGWKTPGKGSRKVVGHILVDDVPYNRLP